MFLQWRTFPLSPTLLSLIQSLGCLSDFFSVLRSWSAGESEPGWTWVLQERVQTPTMSRAAPGKERGLIALRSPIINVSLPSCISPEYSQTLKRLHWKNFFIGPSFYSWQVNLYWPPWDSASGRWAKAAFCKKTENCFINDSERGITLMPDVLMSVGSWRC